MPDTRHVDLAAEWLPYDQCTKEDTRTMFVVIAIDTTDAMPGTGRIYTTDPYCVWRDGGVLVRWPHKFDPTHYMKLPKYS